MIVVYVYNRSEHFKKCINAMVAITLAKGSEPGATSDGAVYFEHQLAIS